MINGMNLHILAGPSTSSWPGQRAPAPSPTLPTPAQEELLFFKLVMTRPSRQKRVHGASDAVTAHDIVIAPLQACRPETVAYDIGMLPYSIVEYSMV